MTDPCPDCRDCTNPAPRCEDCEACDCRKPKHEARPPHPLTQIGRRNP